MTLLKSYKNIGISKNASFSILKNPKNQSLNKFLIKSGNWQPPVHMSFSYLC